MGMRMMAIADLNNDKYNDLVTINNEGDKVVVYYFDPITLTYGKEANFDLPVGWFADSVVPMRQERAL